MDTQPLTLCQAAKPDIKEPLIKAFEKYILKNKDIGKNKVDVYRELKRLNKLPLDKNKIDMKQNTFEKTVFKTLEIDYDEDRGYWNYISEIGTKFIDYNFGSFLDEYIKDYYLLHTAVSMFASDLTTSTPNDVNNNWHKLEQPYHTLVLDVKRDYEQLVYEIIVKSFLIPSDFKISIQKGAIHISSFNVQSLTLFAISLQKKNSKSLLSK